MTKSLKLYKLNYSTKFKYAEINLNKTRALKTLSEIYFLITFYIPILNSVH